MSRSKKVFILFLFIILGGTVHFIFPHFYSSAFTSVAAPFWRAEFSIGSGSLNSAKALILANEKLRMDLEEANIRLESISALEDENSELKTLLGRGSVSSTVQSSTSEPVITPITPSEKRILSPVLVRPPFAKFDSIVIDGGRDLGYGEGDKVYTSSNILIGTISETLSGTSKVTLFSSPGQVLQVLIGSSSISASAEGRGGGQFAAELPRAAAVSVGDYVIVPSLNDKPFGIVKAVISEAAQPFVTILIAPPTNIYKLRWVLVERNDEESVF